MVTVAIAVILVAAVVPAFTSLIAETQLSSAANDVVLSISQARATAVSLNATTQFCGTTGNTTDTLGAACAADPGVTSGLGIAGASYGLEDGVGVRLVADVQASSSVVLNGKVQALRFTSLGLGEDPAHVTNGPYTGTVADVCTASVSTNNHRVISLTTGSIISTTTTTGPCP